MCNNNKNLNLQCSFDLPWQDSTNESSCNGCIKVDEVWDDLPLIWYATFSCRNFFLLFVKWVRVQMYA